MPDFEKAQQQSDADDPEHEDHQAHDDHGQHHGEQQWQQEQDIDRRQPAQRQQYGRRITDAAMIFPAAQPALGTQFPRQPPWIAKRGGHLLLASPGGIGFVEIGDVVGEDVVDLAGRKPIETIAEHAHEGVAVHFRFLRSTG